jgi:hypothetical protein
MNDDGYEFDSTEPPFGYLGPHAAMAPMYIGHVMPPDWPVRADRAVYEAWAKFPSWHIQEAACLVCGLQPRKSSDLPFFPMASEPNAPPPYEGAKTWNARFRGEIGAVFDLFARFKRTSLSEFPPDARYVAPAEFVRFCDEFGVEVPGELRDAVNRRVVSTTAAETNERKSQYRARAIQVARDLEPRGVRVTIEMFRCFIESEIPADEHVLTRAFQEYLREWRSDEENTEGLRDALRRLLRRPGRVSEDEKDQLRRRLPENYARMLLVSGITTNTGK